MRTERPHHQDVCIISAQRIIVRSAYTSPWKNVPVYYTSLREKLQSDIQRTLPGFIPKRLPKRREKQEA